MRSLATIARIDALKRMSEDKVVFQFDVLYAGWDCDSIAEVMERPDGSRYLRMTNHDAPYEADVQQVLDKITEYEKAIAESQWAIRLLKGESDCSTSNNGE
jgi:hypothetical protein